MTRYPDFSDDDHDHDHDHDREHIADLGDEESEWLQVPARPSVTDGGITISAVTEPDSSAPSPSSASSSSSVHGGTGIAHKILGTSIVTKRSHPLASWSIGSTAKSTLAVTATLAGTASKGVVGGIRCVSTMRRNPIATCVTGACTRAVVGHVVGSLVQASPLGAIPWALLVESNTPYFLAAAAASTAVVLALLSSATPCGPGGGMIHEA